MSVTVRPVTRKDAEAWLEMRYALWPEGSRDEHSQEIEAFFAGRLPEPLAVFLAFVAGNAVGMVELSIRPYAEGCRTNRVAFIEGWYVKPGIRQRGVGRALVEAAEHWARDKGCLELASDAQPSNETSIAAHHAVGFRDAGLVRCFCKAL